MSSDNRRRSRTKSLPLSVNEADLNETIFVDKIEEDSDEKIYFDLEGENETDKSSKKPFPKAIKEIAQAQRLSSAKLGSSTSSSDLSSISSSSRPDSSTPSLFGSIYSIGEAVMSFIRGTLIIHIISHFVLGNGENDSNDDLNSSSDYRRCNKSKSFSFSSPKMAHNSENDDDSGSESSDAPDFDAPTVHFGNLDLQLSPKQQGKLLLAEPGRGKINFGKIHPFCNLIGRDFPQDEHVLSASDISSVTLSCNEFIS